MRNAGGRALPGETSARCDRTCSGLLPCRCGRRKRTTECRRERVGAAGRVESPTGPTLCDQANVCRARRYRRPRTAPSPQRPERVGPAQQPWDRLQHPDGSLPRCRRPQDRPPRRAVRPDLSPCGSRPARGRSPCTCGECRRRGTRSRRGSSEARDTPSKVARAARRRFERGRYRARERRVRQACRRDRTAHPPCAQERRRSAHGSLVARGKADRGSSTRSDTRAVSRVAIGPAQAGCATASDDRRSRERSIRLEDDTFAPKRPIEKGLIRVGCRLVRVAGDIDRSLVDRNVAGPGRFRHSARQYRAPAQQAVSCSGDRGDARGRQGVPRDNLLGEPT